LNRAAQGVDLSEFARFLIVGVSNTAVSALLFWLWLTRVPGELGSAFVAQAASYLGGLVWSYTWNRSWTFGAGAEGAGARFVLLQLTLLVASSLSIGLLVGEMGRPASIIWPLVMIPITLLNYVGQRHWVFGTAA